MGEFFLENFLNKPRCLIGGVVRFGMQALATDFFLLHIVGSLAIQALRIGVAVAVGGQPVSRISRTGQRPENGGPAKVVVNLVVIGAWKIQRNWTGWHQLHQNRLDGCEPTAQTDRH
jgi:hypothetical protein